MVGAPADWAMPCTSQNHQHSSPSQLLEQSQTIRSEIGILQDLIRDKYSELVLVQQITSAARAAEAGAEKGGDPVPEPQPGDRDAGVGARSVAGAGATSEEVPAISHFLQLTDNGRRLEGVVEVVDDLDEFVRDDGLNDNVIVEYIRHIQRTYINTLIIDPDLVESMVQLTPKQLRKFLDSQHTTDYEKTLFVAKQGGENAASSYNLILFNSSNKCLYRYYETVEGAAPRAGLEGRAPNRNLVSMLRDYFKAEKLIDVESKSSGSECACRGALFIVDNIMKIVVNGERESSAEVSPTQLLNMPSQPDQLKIILMSRYIVRKLVEIEELLAEGNVNNWRWIK